MLLHWSLLEDDVSVLILFVVFSCMALVETCFIAVAIGSNSLYPSSAACGAQPEAKSLLLAWVQGLHPVSVVAVVSLARPKTGIPALVLP